MRRTLYLLSIAVLACALAGAGCGGGGDKGGGGGSSSSDGSGSSSNGGSTSNDSQVQQVVDSCKQSVSQAQGLSADVKKELNDLCEKAGSGDTEAARKASQDVCVKIVEDTVPAGPARDQSVQACKQNS